MKPQAPKEKALSIYSKFFVLTPQPYYTETVNHENLELKFDEWDQNWTKDMAKRMSLACIDEIIEEVKFSLEYNWQEHRKDAPMLLTYWNEVKTEITLIK